MVCERLEHKWLDPKELPSHLKRYLAQELLDELRDPHWRLVAIDDDYAPSRGHPKDKPAGRGPAGQGRSDPMGSIFAIAFEVERVYELGIDHKHYVLLEAVEYERWGRNHMTGHSVVLERLIWNRKKVFDQALDGYGNTRRPTIRLCTAKADADALDSLVEIANVYELP